MTKEDPRVARLKAAISKLSPGGYSLTVDGFACRVLKVQSPPNSRERSELRTLMNATGLPYRRIYAGDPVEVWDYQA